MSRTKPATTIMKPQRKEKSLPPPVEQPQPEVNPSFTVIHLDQRFKAVIYGLATIMAAALIINTIVSAVLLLKKDAQQVQKSMPSKLVTKRVSKKDIIDWSNPTTVQEELKKMKLLFPVKGQTLPKDSALLVNAPRHYRRGIHKGIDIYAPLGTPALASHQGMIVKILRKEFAPKERQYFLAALSQLPSGEGDHFPKVVDRLYGTQVVIKHNNGVSTRYAHCDFLPPSLQLNTVVNKGETICYVGNSGTQVSGSTSDTHLHWELLIPPQLHHYGKDHPDPYVLYHNLFKGDRYVHH